MPHSLRSHLACPTYAICTLLWIAYDTPHFVEHSFLLPPLQNGKISFEEFVCGLAILLHGSFSDKCKILFQVTVHGVVPYCEISPVPRLFFPHMEEKTVWSTAYSIFVPCGFKDVASCKAWNYERALRRQLIAGSSFSELPNAKKQRLTNLKLLSILWVRETLRQSYLTFEAQNLHTEVIEFLRSLLRFQVPPSWLD